MRPTIDSSFIFLIGTRSTQGIGIFDWTHSQSAFDSQPEDFICLRGTK